MPSNAHRPGTMKGEYREILAADCDGFSECGQKRGNIDADPLSMPSGPAQRRRSESGKANKTGVSYRFSLRAGISNGSSISDPLMILNRNIVEPYGRVKLSVSTTFYRRIGTGQTRVFGSKIDKSRLAGIVRIYRRSKSFVSVSYRAG